MATTKSELFDPKLNEAAAFFKALAHPARLSIMQYLASTRVCMTGDISEELPLSRTTVTQHLTELKRSGLIQGTVDGVKVNYCLDPAKICELGKIFNELYDLLNQNEILNCK
jgi:DNA-binding transcriptional ArsR family regulator